jgi:hypothetical protein
VVAGAAGEPPHDPATNRAAASSGVLHIARCKHERSYPIKPVVSGCMIRATGSSCR